MTQPTDNPDIIELFEPFDGDWKSTTRSIRIDGTVTSVRLETFYWRVLTDIAKEQQLRVPELMSRLSGIAKSGPTEHTNFTSFLRVCCGRYLDEELQKSKVKESVGRAPGSAGNMHQAEASEPVEE